MKNEKNETEKMSGKELHEILQYSDDNKNTVLIGVFNKGSENVTYPWTQKYRYMLNKNNLPKLILFENQEPKYSIAVCTSFSYKNIESLLNLLAKKGASVERVWGELNYHQMCCPGACGRPKIY